MFTARAGRNLIKQHGQDTFIHVAMRADELLDKDHMKGRAVWLMMRMVVKELLATAPLPHGKVHRGGSPTRGGAKG